MLTGIVAESAAMPSFIKLLPDPPRGDREGDHRDAGPAARAGVTYSRTRDRAIAGVKELDLLHQTFGQPGFPVAARCRCGA